MNCVYCAKIAKALSEAHAAGEKKGAAGAYEDARDTFKRCSKEAEQHAKDGYIQIVNRAVAVEITYRDAAKYCEIKAASLRPDNLALKSCPFCGDEKPDKHNGGHRSEPWVICCRTTYCGARVSAKTDAEAVEAWNRRERTLPEPVKALVLACRDSVLWLERGEKFYKYQRAGRDFSPNREEAEGTTRRARAALEPFKDVE